MGIPVPTAALIISPLMGQDLSVRPHKVKNINLANYLTRREIRTEVRAGSRSGTINVVRFAVQPA